MLYEPSPNFAVLFPVLRRIAIHPETAIEVPDLAPSPEGCHFLPVGSNVRAPGVQAQRLEAADKKASAVTESSTLVGCRLPKSVRAGEENEPLTRRRPDAG
jgi:hypothetical protein